MVFVGPYEHHSNELPWRETIADVVVIGTDADGHIDRADLSAQLTRYAARPLRIGSFSAASNVTGILSDADGIAALLHANGALSFWITRPARTCRSGQENQRPAPATTRTPSSCRRTSSSAAPKPLASWSCTVTWCATKCPPCPAAGPSPSWTRSATATSSDPVAREEGGTPAIVESIRAGLVFALKQAVGTDAIQASEERLWKRALRRWSRNPHIEVLEQPRRKAAVHRLAAHPPQ